MPDEVLDNKESDSGAGAGFILLGLGLLVVGSLINASSKKKTEIPTAKGREGIPKASPVPGAKPLLYPVAIAPVTVVAEGQCTIRGM